MTWNLHKKINRNGAIMRKTFLAAKIAVLLTLALSVVAWSGPTSESLQIGTTNTLQGLSASVGIFPDPNHGERYHNPEARTTLLAASNVTNAKNQNSEQEYHGNVRSKIFHRPSCRYYSCKNCVATFNTRAQATKAGYRPCKVCNP
jgi:hypothetical protein